MNIDTKDTITLNDNNEYVVISKINYQDSIYYYLIDLNNNENVKFCAESKSKESTLIDIEDQTLIQSLLPMFLETSKDIIADLN